MLTPSELLDAAVPHKEIVAVIREQWRAVQTGEYILCLALRRLYRDNVHRGMGGCSSFAVWAARKFDMHPKLAGLFSFLGGHLEGLPLTRLAMESGEITYTKAREFVCIATPETEAEWVEYARTHTNRQLERKVKQWKAENAGEEYVETKEVVSELTPEQQKAARQIREQIAKETEKYVSERELLPNLLDIYIQGGLQGLQPVKPFVSIQFCPVCTHTWVPTAARNVKVEVRKWLDAIRDGADVYDLIGPYFCDCEGMAHRRDLCPNYEPPTGEPATSRYVSAELQRRINARDGFRCRRPGCTSEVFLEKGHLGTPFRDGAATSEENLGTHCSVDNALIESGALRVIGYAPFERYYDRAGKFLGYGFDPEPAGEREPPEEAPGRGFAATDRCEAETGASAPQGDPHGDPHAEAAGGERDGPPGDESGATDPA